MPAISEPRLRTRNVFADEVLSLASAADSAEAVVAEEPAPRIG